MDRGLCYVTLHYSLPSSLQRLGGDTGIFSNCVYVYIHFVLSLITYFVPHNNSCYCSFYTRIGLCVSIIIMIIDRYYYYYFFAVSQHCSTALINIARLNDICLC